MKNQRYFVPDLTPMDRSELRETRFRYVFVAESPHVSEVEAETLLDRRPLCGSAGKVWWGALGEALERQPWETLTAKGLIGFCKKHRIAVLNAVQFPLDPKIVERVEDPKANPLKTVGFSKAPGQGHYKKSDCSSALKELRRRLLDPSLGDARIVALGNDADWFIRKALSKEEVEARGLCKIPHPSAWWRRGGFFGRQAREALKTFFSDRLK